MTDWRRLARPQPDGYDTTQLKTVACARWGQGPEHGAAWLTTRLHHDGSETNGDDLEAAPLDHPHLAEIALVAARWPEGEGALSLLDWFCPLWFKGEMGRGCTSGHTPPSHGTGINAFATINDIVGGTEGLFHELAHQRLHCIGVDLEQHDGLLFRNDNEERYFSPIRRDKLRPMSALVHGIYAWTFVTQVDLLAGEEGIELLRANMPKLRLGFQTVTAEGDWTVDGVDFLEGWHVWVDELIREGVAALKAAGAEEVPSPTALDP